MECHNGCPDGEVYYQNEVWSDDGYLNYVYTLKKFKMRHLTNYLRHGDHLHPTGEVHGRFTIKRGLEYEVTYEDSDD